VDIARSHRKRKVHVAKKSAEKYVNRMFEVQLKEVGDGTARQL